MYTVWCDDGRLRPRGRRAVPARRGRLAAHRGRPQPRLPRVADRPAPGVDRGRQRRLRRAGRAGPALARDPGPARARGRTTCAYFGLTPAKIGDAPVTISRTGYTGDLGFEVFVEADDALAVLDKIIQAGDGPGLPALRRGRPADAADRGRPGADQRRVLLGPLRLHRRRAVHAQGARLRLDARQGRRGTSARTGRSSAVAPSSASCARAPRAGRPSGLWVDWQEFERLHLERGLLVPKDENPVALGVDAVRRSRSRDERVGYATSLMYSPMLQRHIGDGAGAAGVRREGLDGAPGDHRRPRVPHGAGHHRPDAALQPRAQDRLDGRARPDLAPDGLVSRACRDHGTRRTNASQHLRRDRRRWRPQRPDQRGVPRQVGAERPRAGAPWLRRWRRDHRGAPPGLLVHHVLLRPEPAAARDHPRARPGQARLHAAADADPLRADGRRRLPAADRGRAVQRPGDRPAQPARRRRLPPVGARPRQGHPAGRCRCSTTPRPTSSATTPRTRPTSPGWSSSCVAPTGRRSTT